MQVYSTMNRSISWDESAKVLKCLRSADPCILEARKVVIPSLLHVKIAHW